MNKAFGNFLKKAKDAAVQHIVGVILTGILLALVSYVTFSAETWVRGAVSKELQASFKNPEVARLAINMLEDNIVGATYSTYFVLGAGHGEYFIPIYISGNKDVELFLQAIHTGSDSRRPFEISIDEIKIPLDDTQITKEPRYQKNILLNSYIKKSKDLGIHDQDEKIYTLRFRIDPTSKTKNTVTIIALINVHGLSKVIDLPQREQK